MYFRYKIVFFVYTNYQMGLSCHVFFVKGERLKMIVFQVVLCMVRSLAKSPSGARLQLAPTYLCKLNKAFAAQVS